MDQTLPFLGLLALTRMGRQIPYQSHLVATLKTPLQNFALEASENFTVLSLNTKIISPFSVLVL